MAAQGRRGGGRDSPQGQEKTSGDDGDVRYLVVEMLYAHKSKLTKFHIGKLPVCESTGGHTREGGGALQGAEGPQTTQDVGLRLGGFNFLLLKSFFIII